ncbi:MAG: poly-beta-1,6-N-acetyl-D-glucosamine N-deacetylase PgaB, partial [Gammaproteobacteria bacterium]|nr:poly-beta-1,6-N-acetyl-D-glucosamine N-deacetylase PgaB [Gammaproteobacteria bacterium]
MMRLISCWMIALVLGAMSSVAAANAQFDVLCYHDVRQFVTIDVDDDQGAMSTDRLVSHFSWIREHGYNVISVDDILAARRGTRPLPPKAVLLTFDDGYASTYDIVFPLLKAFKYSAVVALVGSWLEVEPGGLVTYGDTEQVPRERFLSRAQIKEMSASGLVEFASHSYNLHRGIVGNPQGNTLPAATTRGIVKSARRETDVEYRTRVRDDLARNSKLLEALIGTRPRVMVWPYGAYSGELVEIAEEVGMPITLTLDDGLNDVQKLNAVRRFLIDGNPSVEGLRLALERHSQQRPKLRVAHVDLDYVYDSDPQVVNGNLSALLDRMKASGVNTVFLQAYADPDGDGVADALYFPNRHLPTRSDLFNRVAWQLKTRANVQVYAWLPVLAYRLPVEHVRAERVLSATTSPPSPSADAYARLSPFSRNARKIITEVYADLARSSNFDGLIFHDDAFLSDYEDASPSALEVYTNDWSLPDSINAIRADDKSMLRWSMLKEQWLLEFTDTLTNTVRRFRPKIRTARNLYARPVLQPESQAWFAQSLAGFLRHYDYAAVMAMPYMENALEPQRWLARLTDAVRRVPGALQRTIFEVQARDWRTGSHLTDEAF